MNMMEYLENKLKPKPANPLTAGTGRRLTKAEQREKTKNWPRVNVKAQRAGQKADKNWEMADKPSLTKGYKAYQKALSKHK